MMLIVFFSLLYFALEKVHLFYSVHFIEHSFCFIEYSCFKFNSELFNVC